MTPSRSSAFISTRLFTEFFNSEKSGGIILIACTAVSLILANSPWQAGYLQLWNYEAGGHSVVHWINDGLMTLFFLLIGLELEREVYAGELSSLKKAALPIWAAVGGMLIPAGIYMLINSGLPSLDGAGIPMATDIAFAIGILSLLGSRVPTGLKILLTALAVIDDLGAILIIAIFYSGSLGVSNLLMTLVAFSIMLLLNRLRVHRLWPYLLGGLAMWYFMLHSGVHPSITGVLLAFAIPFGDGGKRTLSWKMQHALHKPIAFIVLPLFALANTCLVIGEGWTDGLLLPASLGIGLGLVAGKPLGIFLFSYLAVTAGFAAKPADLNWKQILGVGMLGGIGFTMSIFIALLAFSDPELVLASKMAIMGSSLLAGTLGYVWLSFVLKPQR